MSGKTKCPCCGHKFKYILPFETLLLWEHSCAVCGDVVPVLPERGKIETLIIDVEDWA